MTDDQFTDGQDDRRSSPEDEIPNRRIQDALKLVQKLAEKRLLDICTINDYEPIRNLFRYLGLLEVSVTTRRITRGRGKRFEYTGKEVTKFRDKSHFQDLLEANWKEILGPNEFVSRRKRLITGFDDSIARFDAMFSKEIIYEKAQDTFRDFLHTVNELPGENIIGKSLLIEDGELCFFSLLYALRTASIRKRSEYPGTGIVGVLANNGGMCESAEDQDLVDDFFLQLGLLGPLEESRLGRVTTPRWKSLIRWLNRINERLGQTAISTKDPQSVSLLVKKLNLPARIPVAIYGKDEFIFNQRMIEMLASQQLCEITSRAFESIGEGRPVANEVVRDLIRTLLPLLEQGANRILFEDGDSAPQDPCLSGVARMPYLPHEVALRSYQPDVSHLYIIAAGYNPSGVDSDYPQSITFGTIVGEDRLSKSMSGTDQIERTELLPYWLVMSHLGNEISYDTIRAHARLGGIGDTQRAFGHETKHVISAIRGHWPRDVSEYFDVGDAPNPSSGKLGWQYPDQRDACRDYHIIPFRNVYDQATAFLAFWTFSSLTVDLAFNESLPTTIDELATYCWNVALDSMAPHILNQIEFRPENRRKIEQTLLVYKDLYPAEPVKWIGSTDHFPTLEWERDHRDAAPWLARALVCAFKEYFRHGHPAFPVEMEVLQDTATQGSKRYILKIRNRVFRPDVDRLSMTAYLNQRLQESSRDVTDIEQTKLLEDAFSRIRIGWVKAQDAMNPATGRGVLEWIVSEIDPDGTFFTSEPVPDGDRPPIYEVELRFRFDS